MKKLLVWASMLILIFAGTPSFSNIVEGVVKGGRKALRSAGETAGEAARGAERAAKQAAKGTRKTIKTSGGGLFKGTGHDGGGVKLETNTTPVTSHARGGATHGNGSAGGSASHGNGNARNGGSRVTEGAGRSATVTHGNGNVGGNGSRATEVSGRSASAARGNNNAQRSASRGDGSTARNVTYTNVNRAAAYKRNPKGKNLAARDRSQRLPISVERQGVQAQRTGMTLKTRAVEPELSSQNFLLSENVEFTGEYVTARKKVEVQAVRAQGGEEISTVTKNGSKENVEVENRVAQPGQWIVTNLDKNGNPLESYIQDADYFEKNYRPTDKPGIYESAGELTTFAKVRTVDGTPMEWKMDQWGGGKETMPGSEAWVNFTSGTQKTSSGHFDLYMVEPTRFEATYRIVGEWEGADKAIGEIKTAMQEGALQQM